MKFVLPHGGYGLGNDLIPWAKAYIISQELGAILLHPAWGNNPRRYSKYFRTSCLDHQWYRVLVHTMPRLRFDEKDFRRIGVNDFAEASKIFGQEQQLYSRKHYILEITGFWGAFRGLETAKDFVLSCLLNTAFTQENLFIINKRLTREKLTIGIHVRLGDFYPAGTVDYCGAEQVSIPLQWYCDICDQLDAHFGEERLQIVVCSDGLRNQLLPLIERNNVFFVSELGNSDISDLIALINADLLVCSISSYSMWAAFLSQSSYIWYLPNLVETDSGLANRFIRSLGIQSSHICLSSSMSARGIALGNKQLLPEYLLAHLELLAGKKSPWCDLVRGGSVILPIIDY